MAETPLRVLWLEDNPRDLELALAALAAEGLSCQVERVETRADFEAALARGEFEIILSDHTLPRFDGISALKLARACSSTLPFILLSGTLGEYVAIESLKAGATDYVLKQHLNKLAPVVKRALRESNERRRAEAALRETEARFRATFEQAAVGIAHVAPDGRFVRVNQRLCDLLGYTREELLSRGFQDITYADDLHASLINVKSLLSGAIANFSQDKRYVGKDGSLIWAHLTTTLMRNDQGAPDYFITVLEDITARQQAEAMRRAQSQVLEQVVAGRPLPEVLTTLAVLLELQIPGAVASILLLDRDAIHLRHGAAPHLPEALNQALDGLAIGPCAGACGTAVYDRRLVVIEDFQTDPRGLMYRELAARYGIQACWSQPIVSVNHEVLGTFALYYRASRRPTPNEQQLITEAGHLASVVIEAVNNRNALAQSEQRFRAVLENIELIGVMLDRNANIILCNDFLLKLTGWQRHEVEQRNWFEIFLPADIRETVKRSVFLAALEQGKLPLHSENEIVTRGGERRLIAWNNTVFRDSAGRVENITSIGEDITERRRIEAALRNNEARLKEAQRNAQIGNWHYLPNGTFTWSDQMYELFKLPRAVPLSYQAIVSVIHPQDLTGSYNHAFLRALKSGAVDYEAEYRVVWPDGQVRTMFSLGKIQRDADGRVIEAVGTVQDITARKRAEAAVRESEHKLRMVIDGLGANMFMGLMTTDGVLIEANQPSLDAAGVPPEAVLGKPFDQTYWWAHSPAAQAQLRAAIARARHGEASRYDVQIQLAGGAIVWGDFSLRPLFNAQGEVIYLVPSGVVIEERKQAESKLAESEALLRTIIESEPACIKLIDANGKLVEMNQAGLDMLEVDRREQVIGEDVSQIVVPEHRAEFVKLQQRVIRGEFGSMEFDVIGLRNTRRTLETHAVPLRDATGKIVAALGLTHDISDRKRAETEREQILRELQRRNEEMEQFIYTISHDLKTPLITIGGFAGLMSKDIVRGDVEHAQDSLAEIIKAVAQMKQHIDDLLVLSRTGRVNAKMIDVDLNRMVARVLEQFQTQISSLPASVQVQSGLPTIVADESGMLRVLSNLIDNALKYRDAARPLRIELGCVRRATTLDIYVRDNGQGIKPQYQSTIFGLFQRANSHTDGAGVGLAISKRVVEVLGGRMWVESESGVGSTFWIALPKVVLSGAV
ncbi:MAG: PAS domain S-box protein [Gammaproteobacteria bacterium]|nr:PAS domain S-box protein [Gammaproteobacteria bacterium]